MKQYGSKPGRSKPRKPGLNITIADGKTEGIWYDSSGNFIGDNKTVLAAADDAATQPLGSPWRMPTLDEFKELQKYCTWTRTTQDGVNGHQVDGPNGNAIFLPDAGHRLGSDLIAAGGRGYYWLSSLSGGSIKAYSIYSALGSLNIDSEFRGRGLTIRPVHP